MNEGERPRGSRKPVRTRSGRTEEAVRPRPGGRSARVVREIMVAALEVFAERGYAGLSFEEVAARARVNKTTVYRRWPTKAALLSAALHHRRDDEPPPEDAGSLRDDLKAILRRKVEAFSTPRGRSMARAILLGSSDPELGALLADFRRERPMIDESVYQRAIERGELPKDTDRELLSMALLGVLHSRLFRADEGARDDQLERIVDLLVVGAAAGGAKKRRRRADDDSARPSKGRDVARPTR